MLTKKQLTTPQISCLSTMVNSAVPLRVIVSLDGSEASLEYGLVNEGESYSFYLSSEDIIKSSKPYSSFR